MYYHKTKEHTFIRRLIIKIKKQKSIYYTHTPALYNTSLFPMHANLSKLLLMAMAYLVPFVGPAAALSAIMFLLKLAKKQKTEKQDLRMRLWREFKIANQEVLPQMNLQEKSEMMKVFNTTIMNAELFKNKSEDVEEKCAPLRKSNRTCKKKVCFEIPPQRSE